MSVILESLLDDERRAECCANDDALALGRAIVASDPPSTPCGASASCILHEANVPKLRKSPRTNPGNP